MSSRTPLKPELLRPTHAQRLILAGRRLSPGVPLYNQAFAFRIDGEVDAERLGAAFGELIRQADVLRTVVDFGTSRDPADRPAGDDDDPWRLRVLPPDHDLPADHNSMSDPGAPWSLPVLDLGASDDPEATARRRLDELSARPFDLDRRLFDAALLKLGAESWTLYFCQHHVVTDARSMMILFRRLSEIYENLAHEPSAGNGRWQPEPLPPARDLLEHERDQAARVEPKALDHWRRFAESHPPPSPLHDVRPRSTAGVRLDVELGAERNARLRELARRPESGALSLDLGLFNLLATWLLAYQLRLDGMAVDGTRSLQLGAPSHNRSTPGLAQMANLLMEVFPLGVTFDDHDSPARISFVDLLAKVRIAGLEFLRYAGFGLSGGRQNRGVQTILNFIQGSFGRFAGLPVTTRWLHSGHHDRQHPLRLQVHDLDGKGELCLQLDLNAEVFPEGRRERTVERLLRLLDAMLDDWRQPVAGVPLVRPERARRLAGLQPSVPSARPLDRRPTVVERLRDQARRDPDAPALSYGRSSAPDVPQAGSLSRGELDRASDRLARQLLSLTGCRELALAAGGRVAVHMGRGTGALVACLGIMKAGAAYVPLDPSWPEARKTWMLADARVSLVLGDPLPAALADELQVPVVGLNGRLEAVSDAGAALPDPGEALGLPAPDPSSTAYLMYTSGSTGRPKGVVISHRALGHYVNWAAERYQVDAPPRFPLFSPLTFDLTVTSIFVPLVTGGQVVIYPETGAGSDLAFLDVVRDDAVDVIKLTPSHLGLLSAEATKPRRVRRLIFGGETLTTEAARRALAFFGDQVDIHNEYGPTEATVGCIEGAFDPARHRDASVPVGRPIDGVTVRLLNDHLQAVPSGVVGEIYVGGPGLADGYWRRPELTAERFVPDPLAEDPLGENDAPDLGMLYRTGDQGRWRPTQGDGYELDYLGRVDAQVKVRGVRMEPAEVEAALLEHPRIRSAVVGTARLAGPDGGAGEHTIHCRDCGLPSSFPGVTFDGRGVCNHCLAFESYRDRVDDYFRSIDDLRAVLDRPLSTAASESAGGQYHCMALLSGGKDSTYALARLVDMGYKVLAFTLDNGFLSDQAKDNIRRVVEALGVDHVFGTTPAMNRIFADSLERFSNVCQGCFKTLYTLSLKEASARDIPYVVTGLSRGQLFETRLTPELFNDLGLDPEQIDRTVLEARKAYHRADDAVSRLLDVSHVRGEELFERVGFVDFYRYCDVDLDEMLSYLDERVPWIRPTDTGRSTNCLINDLGIWVHRRERGFHNYALPYSWDVRLGHKTRDAAMAELDDRLDEETVRRMMAEVGYAPEAPLAKAPMGSAARVASTEERLVAWYVLQGDDGASAPAPTPLEVREFMTERLPAFMVPSHFQAVDALPLTANGKLDRKALVARLDLERPADAGEAAAYVAPETSLQRALADLWAEHLGIQRVGLHDNFYRLGGDSILAIRIAAAGHRQGLPMEPAELFDAPTVARLAEALNDGRAIADAASMGPSRPGPIALGPSQLWCLSLLGGADAWNQQLRLKVDPRRLDPLDPATLERALGALIQRHEALRLRITDVADSTSLGNDRPAAEIVDHGVPVFNTVVVSTVDGGSPDAVAQLHRRLHVDRGPLLAALLIGGRELVLVAHHLAVDALSWPVLIQDLTVLYEGLADDGPADDGQADHRRRRPLPPAPSWRRWVESRATLVEELEATELAHWSAIPAPDSEATAMAAKPSPRVHQIHLDAERTASLLRRRSGSGAHGVLLAATAQVLADWSGDSEVTLFTEHHGRDGDSQAAGTVGWLGHLYPLHLSLAPEPPGAEDAQPPGVLPRVDQAMADVPGSGQGFGLLRHLSPDPSIRSRLAKLDRVPVLVNFLGRAETLVPPGLFQPAGPLELVRGPGVRRPFALEIDGWVLRDRLTVRWTYHPESAPCWMDFETLESRLASFEQRLVELVDQHLSQARPRAEDFPLAKLDTSKMNKLAALLGGRKR